MGLGWEGDGGLVSGGSVIKLKICSLITLFPTFTTYHKTPPFWYIVSSVILLYYFLFYSHQSKASLNLPSYKENYTPYNL